MCRFFVFLLYSLCHRWRWVLVDRNAFDNLVAVSMKPSNDASIGSVFVEITYIH